MKRYFLFIAVCMLALFSMAQQPDAKALLDEAASKLQANQGIQAGFVIYSEQGEVKATIYMDNNRFVLETPGMKTWFDGSTQWTYLEANQEVTMTSPTAEEMVQLNPYSMLAIYQTGYEITLASNYQTKTFYEVRLKAESQEQPFQRINVMLNKQSMHPIRIKMKPQGMADEVDVIITEYHTKKQYADDFFRFNPAEYPQTEVIDLR